MDKTELSILELLIGQEIAVKRLYEVFAIILPEDEAFWSKLAKEEQSHADMLAKLRTSPRTEVWLIDEMQLSRAVIKKSTAYVENKRVLALRENFNSKQAFSLAENVEKFLIDGLFIKLEQKPFASIPQVMNTLTEETKKHLQLILEKQKELFSK